MSDDVRKDDLPNVHPKVRLELKATLAVEEEILSEARPILAEPLVERIVSPSTEPIRRLVKEIVEVGFVLLVVEATAILAKFVGLIIALRLKDEAGVEQDLQSIS